MTKERVQQLVLKDGRPLDLDLFSWDEATRTFSSDEHELVFEFRDVSDCTFRTGSHCKFKTSSYCKFNTGSDCTFETGSDCTFETGSQCKFKTYSECTFRTSHSCTFNTGSHCTFKTGLHCTFETDSHCTFRTGSHCKFITQSDCTFETGSRCTFETGYSCTFKTSYGCTFKTDSHCTFKTGYKCTFETSHGCTFITRGECTFKTSHSCTFNTHSDCIFNTSFSCMFDTIGGCTFDTGSDCTFSVYRDAYIVNRHVRNVVIIRHESRQTIYDLDCLPKDKFFRLTLNDTIEREIKKLEVVDDEFMVLLSNNRNVDGFEVYKAQYISDYFDDTKHSVFVAKENGLAAHGANLKDAIKNLIFKKQYAQGVEENVKRVIASGKVTVDDYRLLTGSCEVGTKRFLDKHGIAYDAVMSIKEAIELVKKTNAYRHEVFIKHLQQGGLT